MDEPIIQNISSKKELILAFKLAALNSKAGTKTKMVLNNPTHTSYTIYALCPDIENTVKRICAFIQQIPVKEFEFKQNPIRKGLVY